MAEAQQTLRRRHRMRSGKADEFTLRDQSHVLASELEAARRFPGLVGLGVIAAAEAAQLGDWPLLISSGSVLLALGVSTAVGVLLGAYPARRAAGLEPTIALRAT